MSVESGCEAFRVVEMQDTGFKLLMGILKEHGCIKAGSLHTACGLPQFAHRICPERVVSSTIHFNSLKDS